MDHWEPKAIVVNERQNVLERDPTHGHDLHKPGAKADADKVDMTFLEYFPRALREVCKVSTVGALKYSRNGFCEVTNGEQRYRAAAYRHLLIDNCKTIDEDTGMLHLAQAAWNLLASLELKLREEEKVL